MYQGIDMKQIFDTKVTYLGKNLWGCRVLKEGGVIVEVVVDSREDIGPAFRDMLRTLDKSGWCCELAHSSRKRINKPGNRYKSFKFKR